MLSSLKINYAKSQFGAVGKFTQWLNEAALYLNCSLLAVPFTYLSIPIGANPKSCVTWQPIVKKCESRLAKWKQKPLSFGGRVTLIKSTLNSIPIYFISFFRIPKVVHKLVTVQRRFLWGGDMDSHKIAWMSWEAACLSKEKGGLRIRDLTKFNQALIGKWKWDLFHHQGKLWARVLDSKYEGWRSLDDNNTPQVVSKCWYDLKKGCHNSGEES